MKTKNVLLAFSASMMLFASCEQNLSESSKRSAMNSVNEAPSNNDTTRVVIKTAELKLQVDDVPQKINEIQSAVNAMNGHVMHYEITSNKIYKDQVACSMDSDYILHELQPEGFMKVRVPVQQADSFIHQMLSVNSRVDKMLLDEEDVTEDFRERKELLRNEIELNPVSKHTKNKAYEIDVNEKALHMHSDVNRMAYRTNYLWFDIHLNGITQIQKTKVVGTKSFHQPLYLSALKALETGWYSFSFLMLTLLDIWPYLLLAIIIFILYKQKRFHLLYRSGK